ncbi:MAG TPA: hypothetical protein VK864_07740 [Longimicrobiales bacterium]|nr:hypothetical protein [Longimicrobiales bacterium]
MPDNYSREIPPYPAVEVMKRAAQWIVRIPAPVMDRLTVEIGEPPLEELWAAIAHETRRAAPGT